MPDSPTRKDDSLAIGQAFEGRVTGVQPYGVFVGAGKTSGLCHKSAIPDSIDWTGLSIGARVRAVVLAVKPDRKLSLRLEEVLPHEPSQQRNPVRSIADGALAGHNLIYTKCIEKALEQGSRHVNRVGEQFKNNTRAQRAGLAAEADHQATFNIDAAFKGKDVKAYRLASTKELSPDLIVKDGSTGEELIRVSSKVMKTAKDSAKSQRPYSTQKRLVPKDQHADVIAHSKKMAMKEASKGPHRAPVAKEYQEVADMAVDRVEHSGVSSTPRTREDSLAISDKAKVGKVAGGDIVGGVGERALQGAKQGGAIGVLTPM